MIKRKKYLLNPSTENALVLLEMARLINLEYNAMKEERESVKQELIFPSYFHYASRLYLIRYLSAEIQKKRQHSNLFCLFSSNSYRIDKQVLILSMGSQFHYLNNEMRVPFIEDQKIEVEKGSLKIILRRGQWWALFTYSIKKSDEKSSDL